MLWVISLNAHGYTEDACPKFNHNKISSLFGGADNGVAEGFAANHCHGLAIRSLSRGALR